MNRFINENKDNWQRLENLLELMGVSSIKSLSRMEVREFGELYRRAASDLAIARTETRDPKLINYLNSLVIRAHGKIYRAESQGVNLVWQFFSKDFPQAFRRTWRYTALAFAIFMVFSTISFVLCYNDTKFADDLGISHISYMAQGNHQWWKGLNDANQIGSSRILTNNILVSLMAFAYGAFFGIGTIYVLIQNGLSIGGVVGVCYQANPAFGNELVTFMVGHGVIELSCIFIAGGAGMLIGYSMINPGDLSRTNALKKNGLEAVRLAIGCASLLVIAGIIEGFLSPSDLPPAIKFGTGILTGIAMYSYLLLVGRKDESISENSI
ncbi:MAG TPA: stage II sporulation protein M [Pyrinomonadaceae bacterium]|nr:stage II sporulation protein M [Pyrinomonadaceae bacterium]